MKDYKLSEVKKMCEAHNVCFDCELYKDDSKECMIFENPPDHYEIDEEQPKQEDKDNEKR